MATPSAKESSAAVCDHSPQVSAVTLVSRTDCDVCCMTVIAPCELDSAHSDSGTILQQQQQWLPCIVVAVTLDGRVIAFDAVTKSPVSLSGDGQQNGLGAVCIASAGATVAETSAGTFHTECWIGCREKRGITVLKARVSPSAAPAAGSTVTTLELVAKLRMSATSLAWSQDATSLPQCETVSHIAAACSGRYVVSLGNDGVCAVWHALDRCIVRWMSVVPPGVATSQRSLNVRALAVGGPGVWSLITPSTGHPESRLLTVVSSLLTEAGSNPSTVATLEYGASVVCLSYVSASETMWLGVTSGSIVVHCAWTSDRLAELAGAHAQGVTAIVETFRAPTDDYKSCNRSVLSMSPDESVREWAASAPWAPLRVWRGGTGRGGYSCAALLIMVPSEGDSCPRVDELWRCGTSGAIEALRCETRPIVARNATPLPHGRQPVAEVDAVSRGLDDDELNRIRGELEYFKGRVEELEAQRAATGVAVDQLDFCEKEPSSRSASQAPNPSTSQPPPAPSTVLWEQRLMDAAAYIDELTMRCDDYKAIATELTLANDELSGQLNRSREVAERMETDTLASEEHAAALHSRIESLSVALLIAEGFKEAAEEYSGLLLETVDCQFEDVVRNATTRPPPPAKRQLTEAPTLAAQVAGDTVTRTTAVTASWRRGEPKRAAQDAVSHSADANLVGTATSLSTSEIAAVEALLQENEALRIRVDVLERSLGAASPPRQPRATTGILTTCFLTLRAILGETATGTVVLESITSDVEDECHAVQRLVATLARLLVQGREQRR